ncbi:shikimate dehydrogenase family protein [Neisseria perflava]|uniref:shikimate dehydrogenase family protein n=1 Tax=Neisseria perflava TaxID=33053 RepID=UPI00209F1209|nr:shikimate dehydrogenase [Neisseria perflava]MCP1660440.1 shikimate dehydrogenase [Neisseria perflava]MCP1772122.1 shikimate dehydrogenase [Neisseria perflava]
MELTLNGETRLYFVVGDPIAQVKSPEGMTAAFQAAGKNGVCLPAHVAPEDLAAWAAGMRKMKNVDGLMITVPHKIAFTGLCDDISDTARFLNTVNVVRFTADGWKGEMFDGCAQVEALLKNGAVLQGKKVIQAGAGGAGTAIAHALVMAGVAELAIVETDANRRDNLIERLNSLGKAKVYAGSSDPTGFDVVVNATPMGMKAGDPLPFDADKLTADMFVGDVVTYPDTAWMSAARERGCRVSTGLDMYAAVRDLMAEFLLRD